MKLQHTQGPWSISAYGPKDNPTYRIEADFSDTGSGERLMTQILAEINSGVKDALLIAAAPDLLDALLACECELSQNHGLAWPNRSAFLDAVNAARAAIKKARGEL